MFHRNKLSQDGFHTYCKICRGSKNRQSKYGRQELSGKEYNRQRQIYYKYRLTIDEYNTMLSRGCDVCGDEATSVDHNHECCPGVKTCGNCIRGVLCTKCNLLEGKLSSNKELVIKILKYLDKGKALDITA